MHLMSMRFKIILLAIVVITALATVFAAMYKPKRVDSIARPVIKIGAYLPITGPDAHLGQAAQNGIDTILKQASQSAHYKYEVVTEDLAQNATNFQDAKAVIAFTMSPEPRIGIQLGNQQSYILRSDYREVLNLFVKELSKHNAQNVALITSASGDYRMFAQLFKEQLPKKYNFMGAVFTPDQKDFRSIINTLRNNDADFFVIIGAPSDLDRLIIQLHDNGISNYQISSLYSLDLTSNLKPYEGIRYIGSQAGNFDTKLSYDAIKIIISAYEANFKKDTIPQTDRIIQYINEKFSKDGIIKMNAVPKIIEKNQTVEIKE